MIALVLRVKATKTLEGVCICNADEAEDKHKQLTEADKNGYYLIGAIVVDQFNDLLEGVVEGNKDYVEESRPRDDDSSL